MIDLNRSRFPKKFDVSVGYSRVTVSAHNRQEAIDTARRALCHQLPRLYDVIHKLEDSRFQVTPITDD